MPEAMSLEYTARLVKEGLDPFGGYFYSNGAKIYPDLGKHIEYASAEAAGPLDATASDWAGVNIMQSIQRDKDRAPVARRSATIDPMYGETHTKGRHENFMIIDPMNGYDAGRMFRGVMSAFLVSRGVITGAGFATGGSFLTTQKAVGIGQDVVLGYGDRRTTEGSKPLGGISTQSDRRFGRFTVLETRHADPHMLPYADFITLAITSLALRTIEHGLIHPGNAENYTLADSIKALEVVDNPARLNNDELVLDNGESISAVGLQLRFARAALALMHQDGMRLPRDERYAIHEWLSLCGELGKIKELNRLSLRVLLGKIEWASKLMLMERIEDPEKAIEFDLQWSSLDEGSLGAKVVQRRLLHPTGAVQKRAAHYEMCPPQTRAQKRTRLQSLPQHRTKSANWNSITLGEKHKISLKNPYESS